MAAYTVRCKTCGTLNRSTAEREGQPGRCGQCHAALAPLYLHPQPLNEHTFDPFIRNYPGSVLVEFWAPWCSHCVTFAPTVRIIAERLAGKAVVVQINSQESPQLAGRFGVRGIPAILLLQGGKVVDQLAGAQSAEAVIAWFESHRGVSP